MKNRLTNLVLSGVLALGLGGCGVERPVTIVEHDSKSARGYDVLIELSSKENKYPRRIRIGNIDQNYRFESQVYGTNYGPDAQFDEVSINAPNPVNRVSLEDFASIKEINRIYNEVMSRQNKSPSNTK